jgi:hypothetical protein
MTCGYICPNCSGNGYDEEGHACAWCSEISKEEDTTEQVDWESIEKD